MYPFVSLGQSVGQGWEQIGLLAVAFLLAGIIGLERDVRHKVAGVRTYTIVGLGAALFTLISKHGFYDVLTSGNVSLDPSRVASQIVSGLGFIGAGIIFVRRNAVRGLTTAASVWLTAAVGAAAGAGLIVLATATTVAYFIALWGLAPLGTWMRRRVGSGSTTLAVEYQDGRGLLRDILTHLTDAGYTIENVKTARHRHGDNVGVRVELGGRGDVVKLISELSDVDGVITVTEEEPDD